MSVDGPAVAPIRARLRLCVSALAEHRVLRHQAADILPDSCAACGAAQETVDHVFFRCPAFAMVRRETAAALRRIGVPLDVAALAGVAKDDRLRVRVARSTADLLLAVRARLKI